MRINLTYGHRGKFILIIPLLLSQLCFGQSRWYVSAGVANVWVFGNLDTWADKKFFAFEHKSGNFQYERRLIGSLNALTGVTVFNAGYETSSFFLGARSKFNAVFVAVPAMVRWNVTNKNALYIDFGILPTYLINAHLKESIYEFGQIETVKGNITKYCDRISFATRLQMTVPFNRFHFAIYLQTPLTPQSGVKGLDKHWGLNSQESTYLQINGFSEYLILGINVGLRVK